MGLFAKSEAELKEMAANLDKRQTELYNRESYLKSSLQQLEYERQLLFSDKSQFETEKANHLEEVKRIGESISTEKADLEKKRNDIAMKEANAKAMFADTQREAFEEVVEKRQTELDIRQKKLDEMTADTLKRLEGLHAKEGEIAKRELAVTEREQKADAGFADKVKVLVEETSRQHQANQAESSRLKALVDTIASDRQAVENERNALLVRERELVAAEQKRDAGYTEERLKFDDELRERRAAKDMEVVAAREAKFSALEDEIAKLKTNRMEDVVKAERIERERVRAKIAKERDDWVKERDDIRRQLENERNDVERQRGAVSAMQSETERRKIELETSERLLEQRAKTLERQWQKKHDELEDDIDRRVKGECESIKSDNEAFKNDNTRLRDSIRIQTELLGAFDQLKRQLGDKDPAECIRELNSKTDYITRLREELAMRPTEEMHARFKDLEAELKNQKAMADQYKRHLDANNADAAAAADLRHKNSELEAVNKSLAQKARIFEDSANEANAELKRLRTRLPQEQKEEEQKRYKKIEEEHFPAGKVKKPSEPNKPKKKDYNSDEAYKEAQKVYDKDGIIQETKWLSNIGKDCDEHGIHFHPRIFKAFHTALKTADWSLLTILAGVSGTGKSELPRLYSHFGGIYFEELSVQPNWDSQESMLGFFNSIDSEFDAQPVLRFLAQSQKKWEEKTDDNDGYPGLVDAVCLILLDELNLAHPELYFAEFLSKLEKRRGKKGLEVPYLPVKIGTAMTPYQLRLGRNVLWTGTMNQDETTKSLSDKVLDRSIIIHFPRPIELKRRDGIIPLNDENRGMILHRESWENWVVRKSPFSDEDVKPYKEFIEKMNKALAVAGRAIGHRVWQSIEYYMANYPDVRVCIEETDKEKRAVAMHTAFEDQLVQKVMPKLRGIDTKGKTKTDCLDKINSQLNAGIGGNRFNLTDDFEIARELGHGQFIWQTANYLNDDPIAGKAEATSFDEEQTPPNGFTK